MPKIVAQKEDWITEGFKLFSQSGHKGIVVDKMAKKLSCNRSSFYWHFDSKEKFIDAIITHWQQTDTAGIIKEVSQETSAVDKLKRLIEITYKFDQYIDFNFYLKRYAIGRKKVQDIIDRINSERINYVAELLEELGQSKEKSLIKAQVFYKHLIGYHETIRYKDQPENYLDQVYLEINQFIEI